MKKNNNSIKKAQDCFSSLLEDMYSKLENSSSMNLLGNSSGILILDQITGGLEAEVIVLASRPSMGKTDFALKMATFISLEEKGDVLFVSPNNSSKEIMARLICMSMDIDSNYIRSLHFQDEDFSKIQAYREKIVDSGLYIYDNVSNIHEISAITREWAVDKEPNLIVIDHLQLIPNHRENDNRYTNLNEIMIEAKSLSRDLNCTVLLLSQLNKTLEQRADKRPVNSDFQDTDLIAAIADKIIFIYKDEVYNENSKDRGSCEIILSKNNNGPVCKFRMRFNQASHSFYN